MVYQLIKTTLKLTPRHYLQAILHLVVNVTDYGAELVTSGYSKLIVN